MSNSTIRDRKPSNVSINVSHSLKGKSVNYAGSKINLLRKFIGSSSSSIALANLNLNDLVLPGSINKSKPIGSLPTPSLKVLPHLLTKFTSSRKSKYIKSRIRRKIRSSILQQKLSNLLGFYGVSSKRSVNRFTHFSHKLAALKSLIQKLTSSKVHFHVAMERKAFNTPLNASGIALLLTKSLANPKFQGDFSQIFSLLDLKLQTIITKSSLSPSENVNNLNNPYSIHLENSDSVIDSADSIYDENYDGLNNNLTVSSKIKAPRRKLISYKIHYTGRLWTKGKAQSGKINYGPLSSSSIYQVIDYKPASGLTKYGLTGFKIWLRHS